MGAIWEVASRCADGTWDHVGDYASREAVVEAAVDLARATGVVPITFGLSSDPGGGHYEGGMVVLGRVPGDDRSWVVMSLPGRNVEVWTEDYPRRGRV